MLTDEELRGHLIKAGVSNLHEFGYPSANSENILTDEVLVAFFTVMLKENLGKSTKQIDKVIKSILKEILK